MNDFIISNKLTDWKNEPTVSDLKKDLVNCLADHNLWISKIRTWLDALNTDGEFKPKKVDGHSSVQPKIIRKHYEWKYASLTEPFLSSDKIFQVLPRTYEDVDAARQNELLLNYQFDTKINKVNFIDTLIRTLVNEGTAIVRVGWDRQIVKEKQIVPIANYYPINSIGQLDTFNRAKQLQDTNPEKFIETVTPEVQESINYFNETAIPTNTIFSGSEEVLIDKIVENKPTIDILNPDNVYIDPTCEGDINKALFVIFSFETNKADLYKAGIYKNLDKINWNSVSEPLADEYHSNINQNGFNFEDNFRKKLVAYEYWGYYDINNDNTLVPFVATWIDDVMIRMEINPYPDEKLPFIFIQYSPVPKCIYGEPDANLISDNQRLIGALCRGTVDLFGSSANGQQGIAKGMLDPINKKRFEKGLNYEFDPVIPPQQGYIQHTYPEVPSSIFTFLEYLHRDCESVTGIKLFNNGTDAVTPAETATGVRASLDSSSKREMSILRRIAKGISDIGTKILSMNYKFLSEQEIVRVTNSEFININREDLKGNFDLKVDVNTAEVDNKKASNLSFMLQTLGNNIDQRITFELIAQIADLMRMPDLSEKIRNYQPEPSPMDQLQIQKLQGENALLQAKVQDLQAKAQATQVDTQMEVSGAKHQQDLERLLVQSQAQSKASRETSIVKALTSPTKLDVLPPNIDAAIGYNYLKDGE